MGEGEPIYPVAVLNAQDKTNDNTVCLPASVSTRINGGLSANRAGARGRRGGGGGTRGHASLRRAVRPPSDFAIMGG